VSIPIRWTFEDLCSSETIDLYAINDHGVAVGNLRLPIPASPNAWNYHAIRIGDGPIEDVHPTGYLTSWARDINNDGLIVGSIDDVAGSRHAYLRDPSGSMALLKQPASAYTASAACISPSGVVAGSWSTSDLVTRACQWGPSPITPDTDPIDLAGDGFTDSWAESNNDAGQVAGRVLRPTDARAVAALYASGAWTVIDDAWADSRLHVNAAGSIVGAFNEYPSRAFIFEGGLLTRVDNSHWNQPTWPGGPTTFGGISNAGEAVGVARQPMTAQSGAASWTRAGGWLDWRTKLPPNSGWDLRGVSMISPSGAYACGSYFHNGEFRYFRVKRALVVEDLLPRLYVDLSAIWSRLIFGISQDGGGSVMTPNGPVPVPPWDPTATGASMAEVAKLLAVHEIVGQLDDPALRRRIQPELLRQAIERLGGIERLVASELKTTTREIVERPSTISKAKGK